MKTDRKQRKLENGARKRHKRALTASQLAPAEELASNASTGAPATPDDSDLDAADRDYIDGSLILDGEHIELPRQVIQSDGVRRASWLSPVFIVVLTLALSFTGFIAYLIANEPP